jgi:general secretion pathway protein K
MFDSLGVETDRRNRLVDSMLDWRDADDIPHLYGAEVGDYPDNGPERGPKPRNNSFETIDELLFVKNMTPDLFYGSFGVSSTTGEYERRPGVRELVTVQSGSGAVNVNHAGVEVLRALPSMTAELAERVIAQRLERPFSSENDLRTRIPAMTDTETLEYLSFTDQTPTALVSRATISNSGVARTVRMLFRREDQVRFVAYGYQKVEEVRFSRWRFD